MTTSERIVVGGDHTLAATAALKWALLQAAETGACVAVVHAFDVVGRADLAVERDLDRARRDARYRTQSWVVEVLGDLDTSVSVIVSTPDGSIEQALVAASRGAQMVVIGQPHGDRHGDLVARLAHSCHCSVMTVAADNEAVAV